MSDNWGYKMLIHVYVEGDAKHAWNVGAVASHAIDQLPGVDFVGVAMQDVEDKPFDQVGS